MSALRVALASAVLVSLKLGSVTVRAEEAPTQPSRARGPVGVAPDAAAERRLTEARQSYLEGSRLAAEQRWAEALVAYNRAWELHPTASTLYNIGFCEARLGRLLRAWTLISRSISLQGGLSAERLALALAERERLRRRLPSLVVSGSDELQLRLSGWDIVPVEGEADTFVVEPQVVGGWSRLRRGSRIYLGPGAYVLERPRGDSTVTTHVELVEGTTLQVTESAANSPAPAALSDMGGLATQGSAPRRRQAQQRVAPTLPRVFDPRPARPTRALGFVSLGVAGLGLATSLVSAGVALDAESRLDRQCSKDQRCPRAAASDVTRYRTAATISNVGFIVGVGASAIGAGLLWWSSRAQTSGIALGVGEVRFTGRF